MNDVSLILKYFPNLTPTQIDRFSQLQKVYSDWNSQINVISRKDIEHLYEKHVLHSLGIAKAMIFKAGTTVLDVGTGGGFPGIPMAILFPEVDFHLVDSIGKKIKVVTEVASAIGLQNVRASHARAETLNEKYDFIISRAVTAFPDFYGWIKNKVKPKSFNEFKNGILYLKGGDLSEEFKNFEKKVVYFHLKDFFEEEFFETKKVIYYPLV